MNLFVTLSRIIYPHHTPINTPIIIQFCKYFVRALEKDIDYFFIYIIITVFHHCTIETAQAARLVLL